MDGGVFAAEGVAVDVGVAVHEDFLRGPQAVEQVAAPIEFVEHASMKQEISYYKFCDKSNVLELQQFHQNIFHPSHY